MAFINLIFCILLFFIIGVGLGVIGTILFFRMDKQWKQILISAVTALSTGGAGIAFISFLQVDANDRSLMLFVTCIGLSVSVYLTFKKLCTLLKGQSGKNVIRILDIVLGYNDFLKDYYESRKKVIDNEIQKDLQNYEEENNQLKEREERVKSKEEQLRSKEAQINDQTRSVLSLKLPVKQMYIPTPDFINMIPPSVASFANFYSSINNLTEEFIEQFSIIDDSSRINSTFKSYLAGIGMYIANSLFGTAKRDIRTHFRISDGEKHLKYTVIYYDGLSEDSLTVIPCGNSLIEESYKVKRAIVASLNFERSYNTKSGSGWEDFMTYAFQCISKDGNPLLSMAVSIRDKNDFKAMLCFFNYCKIELIIEEVMKKILESNCSIVPMLENVFIIENNNDEVSDI